MKKIGMLIVSIAVILLSGFAVSCTDGSFYGMTDEDVQYEIIGESASGPEHVTIFVGDYGRSASVGGNASKGGFGAVDNRASWIEKGAALRVYAFRKDSACYRSFAGEPSSAPACLIDGSLDNAGSLEGRLATFNEPDYSLVWPLSDDSYGENLTYPNAKLPYDFFAYSTGGLEVDPSNCRREDGDISFSLKIDGASDLMYAKATLTESQKSMLSFSGITAQEQADAPEYCYSNWTAHLGINPILSFSHALTRISFDLYPAEDGCNKVVVDKVEVMARDSCIFTVASSDTSVVKLGADFSDDDKDAIFLLTEEDGTKLDSLKYHTDYHGDFTEDIYSRPHVRLGGCFLLPPEPSYKFVFYIKVAGYTELLPSSFVISPKKGGDFLAGSSYVVRVAVHDLTAVDFDVDVDPWDSENENDVNE